MGQIELADRRESYLAKRSERKRVEDRERFELAKDKVVFGLGLVIAILVLVAVVIVLALNPELLPATVLSSGFIGGGLGLLRRS